MTRIAGSGWHVSENVIEEFLAGLRERTEEALGDATDESVRLYLAEHFNETAELNAELVVRFMDRMMASMDADLHRTYYRRRAPRYKIEAILAEKPDFEEVEDFERELDGPSAVDIYDWLRRGEAKAIEKEIGGLIEHEDEEEGVGILGTVYLAGDEMMVETRGRALSEFARKLVSLYFGSKLVLIDEEMIPLEDLLEEYEDFDDELDGKTPCEASSEPAMRPKLLELIKLHINSVDRMRAREGLDVSIDWIVDELGLDELK